MSEGRSSFHFNMVGYHNSIYPHSKTEQEHNSISLIELTRLIMIDKTSNEAPNPRSVRHVLYIQ